MSSFVNLIYHCLYIFYHILLNLWVKISLAKGGIDLNSPLERGPGVCFPGVIKWNLER